MTVHLYCNSNPQFLLHLLFQIQLYSSSSRLSVLHGQCDVRLHGGDGGDLRLAGGAGGRAAGWRLVCWKYCRLEWSVGGSETVDSSGLWVVWSELLLGGGVVHAAGHGGVQHGGKLVYSTSTIRLVV